MPRRSILSTAERENLLALPSDRDELIRHYIFTESDLSVIAQHRGAANRLGFAVQLCYLRYPGIVLGVDAAPSPPLLRMVASQLKVPAETWDIYGQREQTRREPQSSPHFFSCDSNRMGSDTKQSLPRQRITAPTGPIMRRVARPSPEQIALSRRV